MNKQETLEEFIEDVLQDEFFTNIAEHKKAERLIQIGAKWQAERMYRDIEVFTQELKDKIDSFEYSVNQNSYISDYIKEWFEQFKKK
jgi:hypothetical protein